MILGAFIGIGGLGFAHVSNMFLFNTSLPGKFGEYLTRSFCKFLFRFHHHSKSKKPPITRRTNCPISDLCAILMRIGFMSDRIRIRDPGKEYLMNSEYSVPTYTDLCWSTFRKSNSKQQLGCRFDIMDYESYFFVFWHMQLYMSWYIISFFGFTLLNILHFFKYSCTNIFL